MYTCHILYIRRMFILYNQIAYTYLYIRMCVYICDNDDNNDNNDTNNDNDNHNDNSNNDDTTINNNDNNNKDNSNNNHNDTDNNSDTNITTNDTVYIYICIYTYTYTYIDIHVSIISIFPLSNRMTCQGLGGRVDEVDCGLSDYTDDCVAWFSWVAQLDCFFQCEPQWMLHFEEPMRRR